MNTRENGFSKPVSRFAALCDILAAYGSDYQPSDGLIMLGDLRRYLVHLKRNSNSIDKATLDHKQAVIACRGVIQEATQCAEAVLKSLSASGTSPQLLLDATIQLRIIRDCREVEEKNSSVPHQRISFARAYDLRMVAFQQLVTLLESDPAYRPINGFDSLAHLREVEKRMLALRADLVISAYHIAQGKVVRDRLLYAAGNGALARIALVKNHIRAAYGKSSPQYLELSLIRFSTPCLRSHA